MKKKRYRYQDGGGVKDGRGALMASGVMQSTAGLAAMIPGVGLPIAGALQVGSLITQGIGMRKQEEYINQQKREAAVAGYKNNNQVAHGYFKNGGDIRVADDTVKIKDNPGTIDGARRTVVGQPVALNHDELVKIMSGKEAHAISSTMKHPLSPKETFAKVLEPIEKGKGKAQAKIRSFRGKADGPGMEEEKKTIELSEKIAQRNMQLQTIIREAKRGHTPSSKLAEMQKYQSGGGIFPYNILGALGGENTLDRTNAGLQPLFVSDTTPTTAMDGWKYGTPKTTPEFVGPPKSAMPPDLVQYGLPESSYDPNIVTTDGTTSAVSGQGGSSGLAGGFAQAAAKRANADTAEFPGSGDSARLGMTPGDIVTATGSLVGLFGQHRDAFRAPEVVRPNIDNTPISRGIAKTENQIARNATIAAGQRQVAKTGSVNVDRAMQQNIYAAQRGADREAKQQDNQTNSQYVALFNQQRGQRNQLNMGQRDSARELTAMEQGKAATNRSQWNTNLTNVAATVGNALNAPVYNNLTAEALDNLSTRFGIDKKNLKALLESRDFGSIFNNNFR